ncbi:hypothetical protein FQN54_001214 [Arachnomyces sp. PD_36]|nr:hypothetical protein FQN54_001214 [Arachnomyces sp. PD_36]
MAAPSTKYTSKLAGKRVLVLGGTSGIGYSVAEAAVEFGAHVIVSSSKPANVASAVESLKASYPPGLNGRGPQAPIGHVCDLSDSEKIEENLESLLKVAAGDSKINHIVVTAGDVPKVSPLSEITAEEVRKLGDVRFVGSIILAKLIPRYMDLDPANSFTLTGGVNTAKPMPGWTLMAGIGGSLRGIIRGLSVDLKPLRVNVVEPGAIQTPLLERNLGDASTREAVLASFATSTTVGTIGQSEDVAEAYLYLMKDRYVTGAIIESNGGRLLA